jgi:hypothetical protein
VGEQDTAGTHFIKGVDQESGQPLFCYLWHSCLVRERGGDCPHAQSWAQGQPPNARMTVPAAPLPVTGKVKSKPVALRAQRIFSVCGARGSRLSRAA